MLATFCWWNTQRLKEKKTSSNEDKGLKKTLKSCVLSHPFSSYHLKSGSFHKVTKKMLDTDIRYQKRECVRVFQTLFDGWTLFLKHISALSAGREIKYWDGLTYFLLPKRGTAYSSDHNYQISYSAMIDLMVMYSMSTQYESCTAETETESAEANTGIWVNNPLSIGVWALCWEVSSNQRCAGEDRDRCQQG